MKQLIIPGFFLLFFSALNLTAQWLQVSAGMGSQNVSSLAVNSNTIFAGTNNNGVYLSANYGLNWTQTPLNNRTVRSLAANGNYVFAGTYPNTGLYISSNNGTSWTQNGSDGIPALAVNGNNVFAAWFYYPPHPCAFGVSRSLNNGATWTSSLFCVMVSSLAINGINVFAGAGGLYRSTDNGGTWTLQTSSNLSVKSIAVNGNNVFAGTNISGVYLSTDNGISWNQTSLNNLPVLSLASNGNNILAGTGGFGVYVSRDNGATWLQRNEGLGDFVVNALSILNNYIFAGTQNSVYRRPLSELTGIKPISNEIPKEFELSQNYPNPFNPATTIRFAIPSNVKSEMSNVKLIIYDALGREIATLVNEQLYPGKYEVEWNASNYPSGVYFYKIIAGDYTFSRRMILSK